MSTKDTTIKHYEVKAYELHGVRVHVEIDYDEGTIALLEKERDPRTTRWEAKRWVFSGRTIDYMQGWQNILDAMKYAIEHATSSLKKHQDAEDKKKALLQARVMKAIAKDKN